MTLVLVLGTTLVFVVAYDLVSVFTSLLVFSHVLVSHLLEMFLVHVRIIATEALT